MSTATLLHMAKERFHNSTKRVTKPDDPQIQTTFGCPESYLKEIERAAKLLKWGKGHFMSVAAHEYAKTVIAVQRANPEADSEEIQDLAFSTMRAHRKAFGKS